MFTFFKIKCRKFYPLILVMTVVTFLTQVILHPDTAMTSEILHGELTGDEFTFTDTELSPFKPTGNFELSFLPRGNLYLANDGALFQIANSELFKARDEGISWLRLGAELYYERKTLAFSPNFDGDGKAFLGLWSLYSEATNSIRLSSDGGKTWRAPEMPLNGSVHEIAVSPTFAVDQTVYVTTASDVCKLWRSLDGGEHWQIMTYPPQTVWGVRIELEMSPYFALDQTLFAHIQDDNKLWRSTDGGLTWQAIYQNLGTQYGNYINDIAVIPLGNNEIVLIVATKYALVITFDGGTTWYLISDRQFLTIAVPIDFAWTLTLFGITTERQLLQTTDLGRSWRYIVPTNSVVESLVLSPDYYRDPTIYVRTAFELWVSHNNGQTWQRTADRPNVALGENNVDIVVSPQFDNDHILFVYSSAWFLKSVDGGAHRYQMPLPGQGTLKNVAISPAYNEDQTLFLLIDNTIYKSTTGGQNWTSMSIPNCSLSGSSFLRISPDYANDNTIYIGIYGQGCGVYRSSNDGQTWQLMTGTTAPYVTDFDISPQYPSDPTMFFTTYNDGIFRSDDGGSTWTNLTDPSFSPDFCVALSPNFSLDGTLFVGLSGISSGGVFRSEDRGQTWTDISCDGLGGYVDAVVVSPNYAHDQTVIMGGDRGVPFISEDAGQTCFPLEGTIGGDVGIYGKKLFVAAAYDDSRLSIFATTPTYGLYKYYWPNFPQVPNRLSIGIDPNDLSPTSAQMLLVSEADMPLRYAIAEEADWLTSTPLTGTLPATLVFTADPGGSTLLIDSMRTVVTVDLHLSYQQKKTYQIAVSAFLISDRVWLPLIMRNSRE